jgi:hypothetical protein
MFSNNSIRIKFLPLSHNKGPMIAKGSMTGKTNNMPPKKRKPVKNVNRGMWIFLDAGRITR